MKKLMMAIGLAFVVAARAEASDADVKVYQARYVKLGFEDPKAALKAALERRDEVWAEDIRLSEEILVEQKKKRVFVNDPKGQARLQAIGKKILAVSHRPQLNLEFVIFQDRWVNAFTYGGRIVYVSTRALQVLAEDELTFVVAHELSHAMARHGVRRGDLATIAILSSKVPPAEKDALRQMHSRICEAEADALATWYVRKAGVKVGSMGKLFQILENEEREMAKLVKQQTERFEKDVARLQQECERLTNQYRTSESEDAYLQLVDAAAKLQLARQNLAAMENATSSMSILCLRTHPEAAARMKTFSAMLEGNAGAEKTAEYVKEVLEARQA